MGSNTRRSTGTDDPVQAFGFRQELMEKQKQKVGEVKCASAEVSKRPLKKAAEEYFNLENSKQLGRNCGIEEGFVSL